MKIQGALFLLIRVVMNHIAHMSRIFSTDSTYAGVANALINAMQSPKSPTQQFKLIRFLKICELLKFILFLLCTCTEEPRNSAFQGTS